MAEEPYPGYEGSIGPGPGQYGKPHVYARDVNSGAGNCVCGSPWRAAIHPEVAPGIPNPMLPCDRCEGRGLLANSDQQEPWTYWENLPLKSAGAVLTGLVKPVDCDQCGGTGLANKNEHKS